MKILKFLVYTVLFCTAMYFLWGTSFIKKYKTKKKHELLSKKIDSINAIINNKIESIDSIYILTNDSSCFINLALSPNYDTDNFHASYLSIDENIEHTNFFIKHKDSIGYNIYYQNKARNSQFLLKHIKDKTDRIPKYRIIQFWKFTEDQQKYLENKSLIKSNLLDLNDIQTSVITLTEHELFNEVKNAKGLERLSGPGFKNVDTDRFYFVCYNKQLNKDVFKKKIELFKKMYLTDTNNKEFYLRAFKVNRE